VESFIVLDAEEDTTQPPSILIKTPARGLKLQCVDMISHHAWLEVSIITYK
jgi:hypothetical protein